MFFLLENPSTIEDIQSDEYKIKDIVVRSFGRARPDLVLLGVPVFDARGPYIIPHAG